MINNYCQHNFLIFKNTYIRAHNLKFHMYALMQPLPNQDIKHFHHLGIPLLPLPSHHHPWRRPQKGPLFSLGESLIYNLQYGSHLLNRHLFMMKFLEEEMHPTPIFLLGKSHEQRSLVDYNLRSHKELDTIERLSTIMKLSLTRRLLSIFHSLICSSETIKCTIWITSFLIKTTYWNRC